MVATESFLTLGQHYCYIESAHAKFGQLLEGSDSDPGRVKVNDFLGAGKDIAKAVQVCTAARAVIEEVLTQDTEASKKQRDLAEAFLKLSENRFKDIFAAWARHGISSANAVLAEIEKLRLSEDLATFHNDVANKELTKETWEQLYATATGENGTGFHAKFKIWRKMSSLPEEMQELTSEILAAAPYINTNSAETAATDAAVGTFASARQGILNMMGELSCIHALQRPLQPGETRATWAKKIHKGLTKDPRFLMVVPPPLALALQAALPHV
jgi:hypothetical protein